MSDEERDSRTAVGSGVDYKTLFLGACTLVVLLAGAAFRTWDSDTQRESDRFQQALDKLTERIAELEARQGEHRFRLDHLERVTERK
jgi:Flp pilus assembly protein TadB